MDLSELLTRQISGELKGVPPGTAPFPVGRVADQRWNLLEQALPLPVAVLKASALGHNSAWMRRFAEITGCRLAPHGKTTMSPQLFDRQLKDGAWAITLATVAQLKVARRFGVPRVLLANQLVGPTEIAYVLGELARDPAFDFCCLVDSVAGVERLARMAREVPAGRPLQVLLERGFHGGRTGCRSVDDALVVARAVRQQNPWLALIGVEGFEGIIHGSTDHETERLVREFLASIVDTARRCASENLFADGPIILSAGGSAFFDLVVEAFRDAKVGREVTVVLRSGCYLTQDARHYEEAFKRISERNGEARAVGEGLANVIELWAYVLSRPEPTRAILGIGKRDTSSDMGLPRPLWWFRPGHHDRPAPIDGADTITSLNDQHAFLDVPAHSPLAVGDMVGVGISHPCTTIDRWRWMPVVDDDYTVVEAILTFF